MFVRIFAGCLFCVVLATSTYAQDQDAPPPPPTSEPEVIPEIPAAEEYAKTLKQLEDWCEKFDNIESYKDTLITQGEEENKFVDLSPLEQNLFVIFSGQTCANQMMRLYNVWEIERKQLLQLEVLRQGGEAAEAREGEVTSQQLAENLQSLRKLQKSHANKFEATVKKIFEEFKEEIPEKDAKLYLQNVQNFHNRYGLVDRSLEQ